MFNSRVTNWIQQQVELRDNPQPEDDAAPKKLTVRVDASEYDYLAQISERLGVSKTHCAEELLKAAIVDAAQALDSPHLEFDYPASAYDLSFGPTSSNGGAGVEPKEAV